jgi:hypothetical protein
MRDRTPLLHNMSAPPKTVVSFTGLGFRKPQQSLKAALAAEAPKPDSGEDFGTVLHFTLDATMNARTPRAILRLLGAKHGSDPDGTLAALIETRATELPLPGGLLVVPATAPGIHRVLWPDLLSVIAVLTKCSEHVWLRAKNPSLSAALSRRTVCLFVPPTLQHRLPPETA